MIKKLFITSLFFGFFTLLGSAAGADAKNKAAKAAINDADVKKTASMARPRQFDRAKLLIDTKQYVDFFEEYSTWPLRAAGRAYILSYFFQTVKPALEMLQAQALAKNVHWFYRDNQFDELEELMNVISKTQWQNDASFMELIKKSANAVKEFRAARSPKIVPEVLEDVVDTTKSPSSVFSVHPYEHAQRFIEIYLKQKPNVTAMMEERREWGRKMRRDLVQRISEEIDLSPFEKRLVYCVVSHRIGCQESVFEPTANLFSDAAQMVHADFLAGEKDFIATVVNIGVEHFCTTFDFASKTIIENYKKRPIAIDRACSYFPKELRQIVVEYDCTKQFGISVAQAKLHPYFLSRQTASYPTTVNLESMMIVNCEGLEGFVDAKTVSLQGNLLREIPVESLPHSLETVNVSDQPLVSFVAFQDNQKRSKLEIIFAKGCDFSDERVRSLRKLFPQLKHIHRGRRGAEAVARI